MTGKYGNNRKKDDTEIQAETLNDRLEINVFQVCGSLVKKKKKKDTLNNDLIFSLSPVCLSQHLAFIKEN